jgi:hypothetical protein
MGKILYKERLMDGSTRVRILRFDSPTGGLRRNVVSDQFGLDLITIN